MSMAEIILPCSREVMFDSYVRTTSSSGSYSIVRLLKATAVHRLP